MTHVLFDPAPVSEAMRDRVRAFVEKWQGRTGSEEANFQPFFSELCAAIAVEPPGLKTDGDDAYCYEKPVKMVLPGGRAKTGKIDAFKRGCFVFEAKMAGEKTNKRGTASHRKYMKLAFNQAIDYARALPEKPPFVITCDVGGEFSIWSGFSESWVGTFADYGDYESRRRVSLADLMQPETIAFLIDIFNNPQNRDPERISALVTRSAAEPLADLARQLEGQHGQESAGAIAEFLMRCIFTMFAEDVALLRSGIFTDFLEKCLDDPARFKPGVESFWRLMDKGGEMPMEGRVLHFNGKLFEDAIAFDLTREQIEALLAAAQKDWRRVEPAIFGTLLERALDTRERKKLGAHYTPRAYVERLVNPVVMEPLAERWQLVQGEVEVCLEKLDEAKSQAAKTTQRKAAIALLESFLVELRDVKVLDPACGTGNFLYVTMDLMKRLEDEVLGRLADITGVVQQRLGLDQVNPSQFLGIEINPRAAAIADLVIWIGYLQWHFRRYRDTQPQTPILRAFGNIECRDAVLAYDGVEPDVDPKTGEVRTRWGGGMMVHPVTGEEVPDPSDRRVIYKYLNARPAVWPEADYIVSNPPFIGNKKMRLSLGDGYVEALRSSVKIPESCDYVMYWWSKSAEQITKKKCGQFGLITTNSISQSFNSRLIENHIKSKSEIFFAIPDHPWIDGSNGAAVRVAMMGVSRPKKTPGILWTILKELNEETSGSTIKLQLHRGVINSSLSCGVSPRSLSKLASNARMTYQGVIPIGDGFKLSKEEVNSFVSVNKKNQEVLKPYIIGLDITRKPLGRWIIDLFPRDEDSVKNHYPHLYQHIYERVRPARLLNREKSRREKWWLFARSNEDLRDAIHDLDQFIATPDTSKFKPFTRISSETLPDAQVYCIASSDPWILGVLESSIHQKWLHEIAPRMGKGNDLRWKPSVVFDPFPFPDPTEAQKQTIRTLGEQLDRHRKTVQATYPDITITGMYNLLEKIRAGQPLTDKDREYNDRALVTTLKQIHDNLDRATFSAYGWDDLIPHWETQHTDPAAKEQLENQILERLVKLNAQRAEEERNGLVRWLRPDYQAPDQVASQTALTGIDTTDETAIAPPEQQPWPSPFKDQLATIRDLLRTQGGTWTATQISAQFKGKKKTGAIGQVLDILESLGLVRQDEQNGTKLWYAAELQQTGQ